jgi:4-carboxymuconolactone decarboxylase
MKPDVQIRTCLALAALALAALAAPAVRAEAQERSAADAGLPADVDPASRNRLPLPSRETMSPADQQIFDSVMGKQQTGLSALGKERPQVRMTSPGVTKGLEEAHHYLKYEAGIDDRLMAIAVMATARELVSQYEWTQWEQHARDPKDPRYVEPYVIDTIKFCRSVTGLRPKDAAVITLGRELFGPRKVSSQTFAAMLQQFGPRRTVDIEELMALYASTADELVVFDQQLNPGQAPLLPKNAAPCGPSGPNFSWVPDVLR